MNNAAQLPDIKKIIDGTARFSDSMPVWLGTFGAQVWPLIDPSSPLYQGETGSSLMWDDYMHGRGATYGNPTSFSMSKYTYCLTQQIIKDLKTAAVIYGHFPKLIKDARILKGVLDPKTVKGRIDELAKFFSMVIEVGRQKSGHSISRLDQIPFTLIKEVIPKYPGRSAHLKRALKLISDPVIQKNLSAPLQWKLLDITKSSIAWKATPIAIGIPTLSDIQFLFLLNHCKQAITTFKQIAGLAIHDFECRALPAQNFGVEQSMLLLGLQSHYADNHEDVDVENFESAKLKNLALNLILDAHTSAMMLILLFTGIRVSETYFMLSNCLVQEHGFWFLKSKVLKGKPKDTPISEGWLAIDIARDAYDILNYICCLTGNPNLFSSALPRFAGNAIGFRGASLNTKFSRWLVRIDTDGLFSDYKFSVHQCRETLVFQLAKQEVGLPFISMQLKHFQSQFNRMPSPVTVAYGQYRSQLMARVSNRMPEARESALLETYGEDAKFAGGGGDGHKARIDSFFSGAGLYGANRARYISDMARRGVKLMPTSIGSCTKNFIVETDSLPPSCYGDFQCDPDCKSHVITERGGQALKARLEHALAEAEKESNQDHKNIWLGLAKSLASHLSKFGSEG